MANNNNGKKDWRDVGSGIDGCADGLGCLLDLIGCGLGCIVPTMVMAILLVGGISWKAKPMKRFGTQIAAKIQRFRLRPIKGIHLTAKPRSFSAQTA